MGKAEWYNLHRDEAYVETVAVLANTPELAALPDTVSRAVLAAEARATEGIGSTIYNGPTVAAMAQCLGRISAMRDFGLLVETDSPR